MADPFVAEIRIFPFNFAPKGWAWCDGQLFPISQNTALFSLLWTTYGGNGETTFALPDLRGRAPMQPGQGPGLSSHDLGEISGTENVTLLESEIPSHSHALHGSTEPANDSLPAAALFAEASSAVNMYAASPSGGYMAPEAVATAGGDAPHNNMMPYLTCCFCIALQGVYPPRP